MKCGLRVDWEADEERSEEIQCEASIFCNVLYKIQNGDPLLSYVPLGAPGRRRKPDKYIPSAVTRVRPKEHGNR
jgi:hypothetical protein